MHQICAEVKALDPSITTVVGGYHASLCPEDFDREYVDVIVHGEGETTFPDVVKALEKKGDLGEVAGITFRRDGRQVTTPARPLHRNLDSLPLPVRHLSDQYRRDYHFHFWENPYTVETSRGCPYRCTFCSVWKFHQLKCRFRSPERVVEDLKTVKSNIICFVDDNFFQSFRRVERLYELIKEAGIKAQYWAQLRSDSIVKRPDVVEKWAEIGLSSVLIGFEKFREDELKSVNKQNSIRTNEKAMKILHKYDIDMWGSFIVDPQWTSLDFDALIEYVKGMKIYFPTFTILTPLPGTAFFQEKLGELITRNYEVFDLLHTVLPTKLPLEEFYANMARLYESTSLGWNELMQRVRAGKIPVSSLRNVRALLKDVTNPEAYLRQLSPS